MNLFDHLRARVTQEQLLAVASADYGSDVDKHLAALEDVCATGLVPHRWTWHPGEVLELVRWGTGERVDHVSRALCCTLLCLCPGQLDGFENTAPALVESALKLGGDVRELAEELFVWHCETRDYPPDEAVAVEEDDGPEVVALLALVLLRAAVEPANPRITGLVRALADHPWCGPERQRALLAEATNADLWRALIDNVLVPVRAEHPPIDALLRSLSRVARIARTAPPLGQGRSGNNIRLPESWYRG